MFVIFVNVDMPVNAYVLISKETLSNCDEVLVQQHQLHREKLFIFFS